MSRSSIVLATLVAISLLGTSALAQGTLVVSVQEDGGAVQQFPIAGSLAGSGLITGSFIVNTADYQIAVLGGQAQQNAISEVLSSTTSITNETGDQNGGIGHTLVITITATGFTAPITPPPIAALSHIGGTVAVVDTSTGSPSAGNALTFLSTVVPGVPSFTPQTPGITSAGSFKNDQSLTITSLTQPFTISEQLTVTMFSKNDQINYSSSTTLTAVPEPSTMAIAGLGGLALAGYGLRRRKAKA